MKISDIAKIMYTLSQHNSSPDDIKVRDLVYYGRIPHKRWYEMKNEEDEEIVNNKEPVSNKLHIYPLEVSY